MHAAVAQSGRSVTNGAQPWGRDLGANIGDEGASRRKNSNLQNGSKQRRSRMLVTDYNTDDATDESNGAMATRWDTGRRRSSFVAGGDRTTKASGAGSSTEKASRRLSRRHVDTSGDRYGIRQHSSTGEADEEHCYGGSSVSYGLRGKASASVPDKMQSSGHGTKRSDEEGRRRQHSPSGLHSRSGHHGRSTVRSGSQQHRERQRGHGYNGRGSGYDGHDIEGGHSSSNEASGLVRQQHGLPDVRQGTTGRHLVGEIEDVHGHQPMAKAGIAMIEAIDQEPGCVQSWWFQQPKIVSRLTST